MEFLCSICLWQAEQDDLTDRPFPRIRASVVYIASILNTPHPYTASTVDAARPYSAYRTPAAQSRSSRTHAHPRPCRRSGAVGEDASRGAPSWAWEVWRVASTDKAYPCCHLDSVQQAGMSPDSTQAPDSSPSIVTPGPLMPLRLTLCSVQTEVAERSLFCMIDSKACHIWRAHLLVRHSAI